MFAILAIASEHVAAIVGNTSEYTSEHVAAIVGNTSEYTSEHVAAIVGNTSEYTSEYGAARCSRVACARRKGEGGKNLVEEIVEQRRDRVPGSVYHQLPRASARETEREREGERERDREREGERGRETER